MTNSELKNETVTRAAEMLTERLGGLRARVQRLMAEGAPAREVIAFAEDEAFREAERARDPIARARLFAKYRDMSPDERTAQWETMNSYQQRKSAGSWKDPSFWLDVTPAQLADIENRLARDLRNVE